MSEPGTFDGRFDRRDATTSPVNVDRADTPAWDTTAQAPPRLPRPARAN